MEKGRTTFVVPFDGSERTEAALVRAVEYGTALDEDGAVLTIVPEREWYACENEWIDEVTGARTPQARSFGSNRSTT